MATTKFLTALDDREIVEGSIDPLGLTPIWIGFSRRFISNLTTVTTSSHDVLTVLLAGVIAADQSLGKGVLKVGPFLRFEQLAAFTRTSHHIGQTVRGIRVVNKLLQTQVSVDHNVGILSNQRAYGLWGYYTGPMTQSGLLHYIKGSEGYVLSDAAREATLDLLKSISPLQRERLRAATLSESVLEDKAVRPLMNTLAKLYDAFRNHTPTRSLIRDEFARGGYAAVARNVANKQRLLYELVPKNDVLPSVKTANKMIAAVSKRNGAEELAEDLQVMIALDNVLSNAKDLFDYLRHREFNSKALETEIHKTTWRSARSVDEANHALTGIGKALASDQSSALVNHWTRYLGAGGDVTSQVTALLSIHEHVVDLRRTARWIDRSGSGELRPRRANGAIREFTPNSAGVLNYGFFLPSLSLLKGEL